MKRVMDTLTVKQKAILEIPMCGRYTLSTKAEALEARFHAVRPAHIYEATYNAAPSQEQLTILNNNPHEIAPASWGFVPAWADQRPDVKSVINARAESVATKPFFRDAFKSKRCLVLADGFYEWKKTDGRKSPYRIALQAEEPFAFAGIWSKVHGKAGRLHPTFAIITTEANELVANIHPRMPVILREEDEDDWLNPQLPLADAQALLTPYPTELLTMYEVSTKVNSPAFNEPEAIRLVKAG
jgi:putative SOS response-associated peptidase YedK